MSCSAAWASSVDDRRAHAASTSIRARDSAMFAPYDLVKTMRASILVLGPLRGALRRGRRFAARRLRDRRASGDHPLAACRRWARTSRSRTATSARARQRLHGARLVLDTVTVTGTENLMMAATLADGDDRHRERGARARGRGPREFPDRHGRADPGRRHRQDRRSRASSVCAARATRCCPTASRAAPILVAGAITGGHVASRTRARITSMRCSPS